MRVACSVQCVSYKRQGYARQAGAMRERRVANALHAVRYRYARQAGARIERPVANARHAHTVICSGNYNIGIRASADSADIASAIAISGKIQAFACYQNFFCKFFAANGTFLYL